MEQAKAVPSTSSAPPSDDLLRDFERREDEALSVARARVSELENRARSTLESHPERLRKQLAEVQSRILAGQAECDRHAEMLRATLAGGKMKQEEFRAHLVNLEMEYAARCRTAEHGAQLVSEELRSFLNTAAAEVSNLCERVRETLDQQKVSRARLKEIVHLADDRKGRSERRLADALAVLRKAHRKLRALTAERRAGRSAGEESRKALIGLESKLRALADETAGQRVQLGLAGAEPTAVAESAARLQAAPATHADPELRARAEAAERRAAEFSAQSSALETKLREAEAKAGDLETLSARTLAALAETRRDADIAKDSLARTAETQDEERDRALTSLREVVAERDAARAELKAAQGAAAQLAEARRDADNAKDSLARTAETQDEERDRALASLREVVAERDAARAELKASQGAAAQLAEARERLRAAEERVSTEKPDPQAGKLKERLEETAAARDIAEERARQAEGGMKALLARVAELESKVSTAPAPTVALEFKASSPAPAPGPAPSFNEPPPLRSRQPDSKPAPTPQDKTVVLGKPPESKPPEARPEDKTVVLGKPPELESPGAKPPEAAAGQEKAPEGTGGEPKPKRAVPRWPT